MTPQTRSLTLSSRFSSTMASLTAILFLSIVGVPTASAQALPTATGPGSYVQLGVSASAYQADYGKRILGGGAIFIDANLYRRIGGEAEFRTLRLNSDEGVHETTYLVGPRISFASRGLRPYAKLLTGRADFTYPFGYAKGSYFAVAPGAGLDWRVHGSRLTVRLVDVEYQIWPGFSFGPLHPYGVSSGVAWRLF